MDEIKKKLEELAVETKEHSKTLASIDKTLALQAQQLATHIKRTDLAEENLGILRKEFKPVQKHVEFINGLAKLLTLVGVVVGIGYSVFEVVQHFIH